MEFKKLLCLVAAYNAFGVAGAGNFSANWGSIAGRVNKQLQRGVSVCRVSRRGSGGTDCRALNLAGDSKEQRECKMVAG